MNIIEWLNSEFDAGYGLIFSLIAFAVWFILWHLILKKVFEKNCWLDDFVEMGPIAGPAATFGILLFLSIIAVLFISSIQAALIYGTKMIFSLLLFWGIIITTVVLIVRSIIKNRR